MKYVKFILMLLLILTTSGCGDYRELTDMAIVASMGLDKVDDNYEITVQVLDSKKSQGTETSSTTPEVVVYSSKGKTIHETLRNAILQSPKKLYVGHVETVFISEASAHDDISAFFDFFLRDTEASKDFNIMMVKDYKIQEIMDILTPLETIPAENTSSSIETGSIVQGKIVDMTFDKFVANVVEKGVDGLMPVITIKKVNSDNEKINPKKRLALTNELAAFKDYKFLTYLSKNTSIGYNLIEEGNISSVIPFKCNDSSYASIELVGNKTEVSFNTKTNTIEIKSKIIGSLSEINCNIDLEKEEEIKELEKKASKSIKKIFDSTLDDAKKYNESDFLGIGLMIYRNDYAFYKKNKDSIKDMIKNMNENIEIDVSIIQKGSIKEGDEKY